MERASKETKIKMDAALYEELREYAARERRSINGAAKYIIAKFLEG